MHTQEITIKGYVDEQGELIIHLPTNFMPGEVDVTVRQVTVTAGQPPDEDVPVWTEEALNEALRFNPKPANEIITGGWEDSNITDSAVWVETQRRNRRERRQWSLDS